MKMKLHEIIVSAAGIAVILNCLPPGTDAVAAERLSNPDESAVARLEARVVAVEKYLGTTRIRVSNLNSIVSRIDDIERKTRMEGMTTPADRSSNNLLDISRLKLDAEAARRGIQSLETKVSSLVNEATRTRNSISTSMRAQEMTTVQRELANLQRQVDRIESKR